MDDDDEAKFDIAFYGNRFIFAQYKNCLLITDTVSALCQSHMPIQDVLPGTWERTCAVDN